MKLRGLAVVLVLAGLVSSACAPNDEPKASPRTNSMPTKLPSLPPVSHPKAPVPKDRDLAGVVAGLTTLDACALLAPGKAKVKGFGKSELRRSGPHECEIEGKGAPGRELLIRAWPGGWNPWSKRFNLATAELGGAKAYLEPSENSCMVFVPVSFGFSIVFFTLIHRTEKKDSCRETEAFAAAAIPVLNKATTPSRAPHAEWSACAVLNAVLGEPISSMELGESIDDCQAKGGELRFWYGSVPKADPGDKVVRIGGRQVVITQYKRCDANWSEGATGLPAPEDRLGVSVTAPNCNEAKRLTQKVQTLLAGPVPRQPAPRYPLYYRVGEPDSDKPGACTDLNEPSNQDQCQPYVPVEAPRGGREILRRLRADTNVACAISVGAVQKLFGAGLRPVTSQVTNPPGEPGNCHYVEQSHAMELLVSVGDKTRFPTYPTPTPHKIAGRDAQVRTYDGSDGLGTAVQVASADGVFLRVELVITRPRGKGPEDGRVDTSRGKHAEPLAEEIVRQYF